MMPSAFPPELDQFIQHEVASGRYASTEEVVCEAVRLLRDREVQRQALREWLQPGLEELDRGEIAEFDIEEIKAEFRRRRSESRRES